MMIIRPKLMSSVCSLFILGSSLSYAKPPQPSEIHRAKDPQSKEHTLRVAALHLGDLVKKDEKSRAYCSNYADKSEDICKMDQHTAKRYCHDHSGRLPTIEELAQWAVTQGSFVIVKPADDLKNLPIKDKKVQDEIKEKTMLYYHVVYKLNTARETVVDFYFNSLGYKLTTEADDEKLKTVFIWSSSADPAFSSTYYVQSVLNGSVTSHEQVKFNAVRCMEDYL